MKTNVPSRARRGGKHRSASSSPRSGAAALMIGGLVAGTVATAGATTLGDKPADEAGTLAAERSEPKTATATDIDASRNAQLLSLRSGSLDELRDQSGADRSQARSAPEDTDSALTLLEHDDATFTGTTIEVEEAVLEEPAGNAAAEAEPVEQTTQQQTTQQQTTQQATEPAPQTAAAPAPVGGSLLSVAAAYVGYPYQLYGTPPSAFDCSAYTWWVFQQAGISIPRSVAGQKGAVTPVSNPQPGDLVFYNDYHHVGIYAGNGMTYEALNPSSGVRYGPMISTNVWYGRIG
ncbi:MAG: hypothetical protein DCC50_02540 [Acidobacteria bacterium]|nr:MAG: hypothetical protein DCC50_02540 [Acidobacteriota bacterium]